MVKKEDVYPVGSVVRLKKTGQFVLITDTTFLMEKEFLHYLGIIEGRGTGKYAIQHGEVELECMPPNNWPSSLMEYLFGYSQ